MNLRNLRKKSRKICDILSLDYMTFDVHFDGYFYKFEVPTTSEEERLMKEYKKKIVGSVLYEAIVKDNTKPFDDLFLFLSNSYCKRSELASPIVTEIYEEIKKEATSGDKKSAKLNCDSWYVKTQKIDGNEEQSEVQETTVGS